MKAFATVVAIAALVVTVAVKALVNDHSNTGSDQLKREPAKSSGFSAFSQDLSHNRR